MKILVACEFSGTVRDACIANGHEAMSCDLLPTESPGPHYQGDVRDVLHQGWDLMIAHPPCTYLSVSGMHWTTRGLRDPQLTEDALAFVWAEEERERAEAAAAVRSTPRPAVREAAAVVTPRRFTP